MTVDALNNRGVALLTHGRYDAARRMFSKALLAIQRRWQHRRSDRQTQSTASGPARTQQHPTSPQGSVSPQCRYRYVDTHHKCRTAHPQHDFSYVFLSAIEMHPDEHAAPSQRRPCRDNDRVIDLTVSFIVLYNLALTSHLQAETASASVSPSTSQRNYRHARRFYKLAFNTFRNDDIPLSIETTLPILNNLFQVNRRLNQTAAASSCRESLLRTLLHIRQEQMDRTDVTLEGFYSNISDLILKQSGTASAA